MKNLMALLKLDIIYIKTYWQWVLMFIGISIVLGISMQNGPNFLINLTIFLVVITLFPFESMDKGLNILYGSLPTNRKSIITGRYIFLLIVLSVLVVGGMLGGIVLELIFQDSIDMTGMLTGLAICVGTFLIFTGWNAPFLFKYGYARGRFFFWGFIGVIMLVIYLPNLLDAFGVREANRFSLLRIAFENYTTTSIIMLSVGVAAFAVSFFLSQKIYSKKDF